MSWRRVSKATFMLLIALVSLLGTTNLAQASARVTYGVPTEGNSVILGDTSIDGPAMTTMYAPETALAWVGTDAQHHLNIMTSSDGLHYSNKHILPEMSLWRPTVAFIDSGRGAPYGTIVLAWTGTDARHTLNIEYIKMPEFTVTQKITLWGEWSFTAPSVTTVNGDINSDIYLSWAGTDQAHTLNVMRLTDPSSARDKHILWGWSSISRPNISTDRSTDGKGSLILSWTGVNNRIYFAYASEASRASWTMPAISPLSLQTAWAPSMIGFFTQTQPSHWLAWTGSGTTATHGLHVRYTQQYPTWGEANTTAVLEETAISSPALAAGGVPSQLFIAWTGTDSAHHLNVALITA